jgi:hypothetical protein
MPSASAAPVVTSPTKPCIGTSGASCRRVEAGRGDELVVGRNGAPRSVVAAERGEGGGLCGADAAGDAGVHVVHRLHERVRRVVRGAVVVAQHRDVGDVVLPDGSGIRP